MEAVVGLLVMLLGVSHGLETYCDGRKDGAQCYGALGGTVVLHLMDSASEIARYEWSKESTEILKGTKNKIATNIFSSRSVFTPSNGTFRINDLRRNDSGKYKLILMNSDLQKSGQRTLNFSVQAPVSSVLLVSECLQGEMRVSCSSVGGDDPQYSWTLDGRELTDDQLLSGNTESESITLRANVSGYLVCSVRNGVSDVCGFTSNKCTSSVGTQKWVHESNDTVCIKPPTLDLETYCDGRKDGAQCYGALGGTVFVQLMDSASEIPRYYWASGSATILKGKKNKITYNELLSRSVFTPSNGTYRINDLSRNDSREYKLSMLDSNLQKSGERTLHLSVQAPVSSVLLVSECLQGGMRVSCSSVGGDDPQYSWTLDGREVTDDELLSGNIQSENITLRANVSGYLVCSVRNGVSDVCGFTVNNCTLSNETQKWVHESSDPVCIKPTTVPTTYTADRSLLICGLQAFGFILTVTAISIYFTCKRKKYEKSEYSAVPQTTEYPQDSVVMVVM